MSGAECEKLRCACCLYCRGCVHCLKLSPNLRRQPSSAAPTGASSTPAQTQQAPPLDTGIQQLDAIFSVALKSMETEEYHEKIMDELNMMNKVRQQMLST